MSAAANCDAAPSKIRTEASGSGHHRAVDPQVPALNPKLASGFVTLRPSMAGGVRGDFAARAPDVDAGEQEQPDHVDEVPIPGGELEAEVLGRGELAKIGAD